MIASDTQILWEDSGQVTGNPEQMDSLRAESHGTLAVALFLGKLYEAGYLRHTTRLQHFCDNKRVVDRLTRYSLNQEWYPNSLLLPHMDVQMEVEDTISKLPHEWTFQHVKGHQDESQQPL